MRTLVAIAGLLLGLAGGSASYGSAGDESGIWALNWKGDSVTGVNLTNDGVWPASSPDERRIAFISSRDGDEAVWVMNSDGTGPRRVTEPLPAGEGELGSPTWSPDAKRIAFTAVHSTDPYGRHRHQSVYVVETGGDQARLVDDDTWGAPAFSADSKLISYGVNRTGIGVARADGSGAHEFQFRSYNPKWAPHDRRILALSDARVRTMDASGHLRWILGGYVARAAAWTRDGRIVFVAGGTRRPGLYVTRPGSQRARRVVDIAAGRAIALSADSRYAAVTATGSTYLIRLSGGSFMRLEDEAGFLAWSSHDERLAFTTDTAGRGLFFADRRGLGTGFGFDLDAEFFGLTWNGGRLLVGSRGVDWPR